VSGAGSARPVRPLPPFTEEHEALRASIRRFVAGELRPHARAWEEARWFLNEIFMRLGELGYLGLKYPREYGGGGGDHLHDAVLAEELSRCGSGGLAAGIGAHVSIATPPIWRFGTEEQNRRFLTPAISGERIGALGITEPGAGSDVAGIRTFARRVDGGYLVNGSKRFITNGVRADFVVTAVKTTREGGHHGLSFLVVEKGMPGFTVSRKLEKLGWHASDTAELAFQDVFVPEENLLGEENKGFYLIMAGFQWERLAMALGAVGSMGAVPSSACRPASVPATRSPSWPSGTRPRAPSPTTRFAFSPAGVMRCGRSPRRSCSPSAPRSRWPRRRSGCWTATWRWAGRCATPASGRSAAAPTR
jgi:acyl-CoA dehydrogenase